MCLLVTHMLLTFKLFFIVFCLIIIKIKIILTKHFINAHNLNYKKKKKSLYIELKFIQKICIGTNLDRYLIHGPYIKRK